VAIGDICNTADSASIKSGSSIYWHNFIEVSGFVDAAATARLTAAEQILSSFLPNTASSANSLSPHAPYSVSAALFYLLNDKTANQRISIHNQESAAEDELYWQKTGAFLDLYRNLGIPVEGFQPTKKSSFQSWSPYFNKGQTIISVHNTFIGQDDILQASSNMNFCICINANLYIENSLPPLDLLLKNGCQIILGTDSYASNNSLQIADEIKTIQQHFPHIPLQNILQWATLNGAKALGIDDRFGSFEKGKAPGMVLLGEGGTNSIVI
jgi:cytosine/adenosine deaminase-related metal-dependent hydrolase